MKITYGKGADTVSLILSDVLICWCCFRPFFTTVAFAFYFCDSFSDALIISTIQRRRRTRD